MRFEHIIPVVAMLILLAPGCGNSEAVAQAKLEAAERMLAAVQDKLRETANKLDLAMQRDRDSSNQILKCENKLELLNAQVNDKLRALHDEQVRNESVTADLKAEKAKQKKWDEEISLLRMENQTLSNYLELARAKVFELQKAALDSEKPKKDAP